MLEELVWEERKLYGGGLVYYYFSLVEHFCKSIILRTHATISEGSADADRVPRYVAMHTMQEDEGAHGAGHEEVHGNGYLDINLGRDAGRQKGGPSFQLVLAAVAGMLLPLLTQIGHAH